MSTPDSDLESRDAEKPQQPINENHALPAWRKCIILFVVSWMTLAVTFSSTSLLPATPEIASEFNSTSEIINVTNSGVLLAMGFSSLLWGPVGNLIGRRNAYNIAIAVLCATSAGTAASINFSMFTAMRILAGFTGTSFMVSGQTILADIFEPAVRGTAVGCFMVGSVTGPAIGPCIGGLIVTFSQWRIIYWLQVAMSGFGLVLSLIFVPDIKQKDKQVVEPTKRSCMSIIYMFNPLHTFQPWVYPNILLADLTCGLLAFFQYSLLTSARSIFNPRFHLTTGLVSGLFYLAPGAGFLVGSVVGGKNSDRTVRRYIRTRDGVRLPQDRLNSGLITLFGVLPIAALIYGWTLQEGKGGMVVPIISAFFAGAGLMGSFNGLNTYAGEAMPHKRGEVISGKYIIQYCFSAVSSAVVVPMINAIGVGWTFTIAVVLILTGGFLVMTITRWGIDMQRWMEQKLDSKH